MSYSGGLEKGLDMKSGEFNTTVLRGFPVLVEYNMHGGYADWWLCTISGDRALFIEAQLDATEQRDIDEQCHLDNNEREWAAGRRSRSPLPSEYQ